MVLFLIYSDFTVFCFLLHTVFVMPFISINLHCLNVDCTLFYFPFHTIFILGISLGQTLEKHLKMPVTWYFIRIISCSSRVFNKGKRMKNTEFCHVGQTRFSLYVIWMTTPETLVGYEIKYDKGAHHIFSSETLYWDPNN